jgi:hypothetical protein
MDIGMVKVRKGVVRNRVKQKNVRTVRMMPIVRLEMKPQVM